MCRSCSRRMSAAPSLTGASHGTQALMMVGGLVGAGVLIVIIIILAAIVLILNEIADAVEAGGEGADAGEREEPIQVGVEAV